VIPMRLPSSMSHSTDCAAGAVGSGHTKVCSQYRDRAAGRFAVACTAYARYAQPAERTRDSVAEVARGEHEDRSGDLHGGALAPLVMGIHTRRVMQPVIPARHGYRSPNHTTALDRVHLVEVVDVRQDVLEVSYLTSAPEVIRAWPARPLRRRRHPSNDRSSRRFRRSFG
jgi:hypothetical protein